MNEMPVSARADTRTRESARRDRPARGRLAGDGNRQEQTARLALYPQTGRAVRALPQPENPRLGTRIRLAAVQPLSFPPGDQPAPVRADCAWCQRRSAVRDGLCDRCLDDQRDQAADRLNNNGPVTVLAVPAHDQPGEDPDGHLGE